MSQDLDSRSSVCTENLALIQSRGREQQAETCRVLGTRQPYSWKKRYHVLVSQYPADRAPRALEGHEAFLLLLGVPALRQEPDFPAIGGDVASARLCHGMGRDGMGSGPASTRTRLPKYSHGYRK